MKVTKKDLREVIGQVQYTILGQDIYDEVNEQAIKLILEYLNRYGPDEIIIEAIYDALRDAAKTIDFMYSD